MLAGQVEPGRVHAIDFFAPLVGDIPVRGQVFPAAAESQGQELLILLAIGAGREHRLLPDVGLVEVELAILVEHVLGGGLALVRQHVGDHLG